MHSMVPRIAFEGTRIVLSVSKTLDKFCVMQSMVPRGRLNDKMIKFGVTSITASNSLVGGLLRLDSPLEQTGIHFLFIILLRLGLSARPHMLLLL